MGGFDPYSSSKGCAELVVNARLRRKILGTIEAEWHRTADALALITGEKLRLANNAALQRSMRPGFPTSTRCTTCR